jgi:hypothetical protein
MLSVLGEITRKIDTQFLHGIVNEVQHLFQLFLGMPFLVNGVANRKMGKGKKEGMSKKGGKGGI